MNTGQTLLVAGALFLLLRLALSTNTLFLDTGTMQEQNEAIATATSIGQEMIEQITTRGYDEEFPGGNLVDSADAFVPPSLLGRDPGESSGADTSFDDIDDFKGFTDSVDTPRLGKFYRTCEVVYVAENSPFDVVARQTFLKRIEVSVTNTRMIDPNDPLKLKGPIVLNRIVTYH